MTPLYRLLAPYLGKPMTLAAMGLIYAAVIFSCVLVVGWRPWNPMVYLDVRLR